MGGRHPITPLEQDMRIWLVRTGRRSLATWARELGVTPSYLTLIAQGKRTPALPLAVLLAEQTGIPIERFIAAS